MKRKTYLLFFFTLISLLNLGAQTKFDVSLTVRDSVTRKALEAVTVSMTRAGHASAAGYAITDAGGTCLIKALPAGDYTLDLTMMGYVSRRIPVKVTGREAVLNMGEQLMAEDVTYIGSVVVTATGNPIVAKKDTLEYTASSFHTTENAVLEDLLKKLPGAEISSDGSITMNGKNISKVMIDGKEFFASDPTIATKNLPANIVDKVRVVDRKSDQARFTGIEDGEEETVLDLTIQKGMMNGLFGTLTGGYGTENRFQGGGMMANFTDASQFSFVGNANNTNNRGFRDIVGSAMGGMRSGGPGGMISGGRGGMGGMWGRNEGLTTSYMAGLNGGRSFGKDVLNLHANYFFNHSSQDREQNSSRENLLPTNHFFYNQEKAAATVTTGHRASVDVEWKPNERNQITFRPRFNYGSGNFEDKSEYESHYAEGKKINSGNSLSSGSNKSLEASGMLMVAHRFKKPGHTLSLFTRYNISSNEMDGRNYSNTTLYGKDKNGRDSVTVVDQIYAQRSQSWSVRSRLSYTVPVANKRYIELEYSYYYNARKSSKDANNKDMNGDYTLQDPNYSNRYNNNFVNQEAGINYRSNQDKYRLTVGMSVQPAHTHSVATFPNAARNRDISLNVINYAPNAQFEYSFADNTQLRLDYRGRTRQPSINQLSPVLDNSNPLYVAMGNPELNPEFTHNFRVNYMDTKMETFRTLFARLEANYTMNDIVNKSWYDDSGIQYSQPVNEGYAVSASGAVMYNTPIRRSKFYIGNDVWLRFSRANSYTQSKLNVTHNYGVYETLRFTYRGDKLNASVSARAGYSYAVYSLKNAPNSATWNNNVRADIDWTTPWWGISIASDFTYNYYIGYGSGYNQDAMIWNASLEKRLFKGRATLAVRAYDLLNQALAIRRTTNDNYIEDVENNVLRQYFMFSFTYRFGSFGSGKNRMGMPGRSGAGSGRGHGSYSGGRRHF